MGLALDEPKETDKSYDIEGYKYVIDSDLYDKVQPVKIDFMQMGFKIDCAYDFSAASGCSGCGSSCEV